MKILALCGSLRVQSSNGLLLKAAEKFLQGQEWLFFDIAKLPFFDPDLQFSGQTPHVVLDLRTQAKSCDLIFIATPEYTHSIPGLLKNGLEWLFCEDTQKKPVAVVIGSAQGEAAQAHLFEVLKTMDFSVREQDFLIVKGARSKINSDGVFTDAVAGFQFEKFCAKLARP